MATVVFQRLRDPVHDLIEIENSNFGKLIWRLLESRPFQRLRRIKQLGFSDLVYPGATHSRFAHSSQAINEAKALWDKLRAVNTPRPLPSLS